MQCGRYFQYRKSPPDPREIWDLLQTDRLLLEDSLVPSSEEQLQFLPRSEIFHEENVLFSQPAPLSYSSASTAPQSDFPQWKDKGGLALFGGKKMIQRSQQGMSASLSETKGEELTIPRAPERKTVPPLFQQGTLSVEAPKKLPTSESSTKRQRVPHPTSSASSPALPSRLKASPSVPSKSPVTPKPPVAKRTAPSPVANVSIADSLRGMTILDVNSGPESAHLKNLEEAHCLVLLPSQECSEAPDSLFIASLPMDARQSLPYVLKISFTSLSETGVRVLNHCLNTAIWKIVVDGKPLLKALQQTLHRKSIGPNSIYLFDLTVATWMLQPETAPTVTFNEILQKHGSGSTLFAAIYDEAVVLWNRLSKEGLLASYALQEGPLVGVLAQMELNGVGFNPTTLTRMEEELVEGIAAIEQQAQDIIGHSINLSSPQEVSKLLYDELQLKPPAEAVKGKKHHSTSEKVLEALSPLHPVPSLVIKYRKLSKILNTYVRPFAVLGKQQAASGRYLMHTTFNQCRTGTGRLSSSNPNLQNLPSTSWGESSTISSVEGTGSGSSIDAMLRGINIRSAFIPRSAQSLLLSVDYSQIEMRVLAHVANDTQLLSLFAHQRSNPAGDIYKMMAAKTFHKPVEAVSQQERQMAKTVCLGIVYGMGPADAARTLGITFEEAVKVKNQLLASFPGIKLYSKNAIAFARSRGFVATLTHRKRWLPNMNSSDSSVRSYEERKAVNTVIQGSASDLMKTAMLLVSELLADWSSSHPESEFLPLNLLQIHDELVVETPGGDEEIIDLAEKLSKALINEVPERLGCVTWAACEAQKEKELRPFQLPAGVMQVLKAFQSRDRKAIAALGAAHQLRVGLQVKRAVGASWGALEDFDAVLTASEVF